MNGITEVFVEFYTNMLGKAGSHKTNDIAGDKAPGPDSFGSQFFKDCWDTINGDLIANVQEFFRLKTVLPSIISANQSAFVASRTIVQNVLICQDLVRLYNRKQSTSSCLIKIDLKKAYDTLEWAFVEKMLYTLEFPHHCIKWIMNCISTVQYSIAINGGMKGFGIHTKCKSLKLNHLCFADDVLLFSKGNFQSVLLLLRGLKTFSNSSGLNTNATKSNFFSVNMPSHSLNDLIELTGYAKGVLPFRYLGVPISSKRISKMDCEVLLDKVTTRIKTWGTRHLSYTGRVLLVNFVLLHVHSYWSSIFILPKQALKAITALCRNFLLDGKVATNKSPLVA
ncbi:uncharacterized protein LOC132601271 [Lycium barbarum]|uniref:uncharacterized protein LOC132601271 n=1 Tax=Lycium barbarum TaxID=112863 RepID=UPI00293EDAA0|nr:uncharacterized protein LOC132601271 [Lycium barbarum]